MPTSCAFSVKDFPVSTVLEHSKSVQVVKLPKKAECVPGTVGVLVQPKNPGYISYDAKTGNINVKPAKTSPVGKFTATLIYTPEKATRRKVEKAVVSIIVSKPTTCPLAIKSNVLSTYKLG